MVFGFVCGVVAAVAVSGAAVAVVPSFSSAVVRGIERIGGEIGFVQTRVAEATAQLRRENRELRASIEQYRGRIREADARVQGLLEGIGATLGELAADNLALGEPIRGIGAVSQRLRALAAQVEAQGVD
jgi:TolA-binding protein